MVICKSSEANRNTLMLFASHKLLLILTLQKQSNFQRQPRGSLLAKKKLQAWIKCNAMQVGKKPYLDIWVFRLQLPLLIVGINCKILG